jgi:hypothetical protein
MKEEIIKIMLGWIEHNEPIETTADKLLDLFAVSGSLPLPRCKCGQNALPYKAKIELDKCSRCGNDR